jgi:hypothetical protein
MFFKRSGLSDNKENSSSKCDCANSSDSKSTFKENIFLTKDVLVNEFLRITNFIDILKNSDSEIKRTFSTLHELKTGSFTSEFTKDILESEKELTNTQNRVKSILDKSSEYQVALLEAFDIIMKENPYFVNYKDKYEEADRMCLAYSITIENLENKK